jgi:hypothetical protein
LLLGESAAISILRDQRAIFNEKFDGFTFTKFDGTYGLEALARPFQTLRKFISLFR